MFKSVTLISEDWSFKIKEEEDAKIASSLISSTLILFSFTSFAIFFTAFPISSLPP